MDVITLSWVDYILFCLVFGLSCLLGLYFGCFGNRQETKSDYLLGGRKMPVTPVAASLIASTLSSSSLLGIPTEIYLFGTQYWMMVLSVILCGLCTNYIFLPVYYKLGLTTLYEYLELRFNIHVRRVTSFIYIIECITLMPCMVYAPALALNQMNGFDIHLIAIVLSVVCIFYTALGGLRGVVWSSTLQFCVTACTLITIIVMGVIAVGGWSQIWQKANLGDRLEFFNFNPDPTLRTTLWSVVIGNWFIWMSYSSTSPAAVQRLLALPHISDSRKALVAYTIGTIIAKSLSCFTGLIMFARYFGCDPIAAGFIKRPDQVYPYFVMDVSAKSSGISGLFIAAIFSTALSSLSTLLNAVSGTIYVDFVEKFMPIKTTERVASNTIRGISVLIGVITVAFVFIVERLGTILQLIISFSGIVAGPTVGICAMGVLFPTANAKGVIWGALTAILFLWFVATGSYINNVNSGSGYLPKPLPTQSCNSSIIQSAMTQHSNTTRMEPQWLYEISFYYYGFLGTMITIVVGLLVSWITRKGTKEVNLDLLCPLSRWFTQRTRKTTVLELTTLKAEKDVTEPFLTNFNNIGRQ